MYTIHMARYMQVLEKAVLFLSSDHLGRLYNRTSVVWSPSGPTYILWLQCKRWQHCRGPLYISSMHVGVHQDVL